MDKQEHDLAAYAHGAWREWMEYQFSCCERQADGSMIIPAEKVERWTRQMQTAYDDLPKEEQLSDIAQAQKIGLVMQKLGNSVSDILAFRRKIENSLDDIFLLNISLEELLKRE